MEKQFSLKVNGEHEFSFTPEEANKSDVLNLGKNRFHLLKNHKSYKAEITNADFLKKNYTVLVNGNEYKVSIANELDRLIKELGFEVGSGKKVQNVLSPMPGLIFEINVAEGDEVKEGDNLLILEAMKMENVISSPRDGMIKKVAVKKGEAIEKKALLIEFE